MEISANTNNYQALNTHQKPVTLPIEPPKEPTYSNKDIYDASQGNLIKDKDGKITLTPQGETNIATAKENQANAEATQEKAQTDAERATAVDYLAYQSNKSQVDIYLAVATDGKYKNEDSLPSVIESLRDVQKQNNAVQAYASYQENQDFNKPILYTNS